MGGGGKDDAVGVGFILGPIAGPIVEMSVLGKQDVSAKGVQNGVNVLSKTVRFVNSCDLLVKVDMSLVFVKRALFRSRMTIPNGLLTLFTTKSLFLLLLPSFLIISIEEIPTSTSKLLECRANIGT